MSVAIEEFEPTIHDTRAVARLIYQADPSLMRLVFGGEESAVKVIARLVGMEHNEYAGSRILCARDDDQVVGIIAGLTGAARRESKSESGKEWGRALGFLGMVRAIRYGSKLEGVATTEVGNNEYYISALTVDDRYRGQGIGSTLLEHVLREHEVVVTDVNIAKADAIRFYERHGFTIQKEMTFVHKGAKVGNFQIKRG